MDFVQAVRELSERLADLGMQVEQLAAEVQALQNRCEHLERDGGDQAKELRRLARGARDLQLQR